jgi:outer membrane receptor protein involved in Fe transport
VFFSGDFLNQVDPVIGLLPGTIIDGVDPANLVGPKAGDYALVNMNVGVNRDNLSVSVFARNLFNSRGTSAYTLPLDQSVPGEAPFSPSQPRTFGINFSVKF